VFLWILVVGDFIVRIYDYNRSSHPNYKLLTLGISDLSIILIGLLGLYIRSIIIVLKDEAAE
jgi:hypothetical protein